MIKVKRALISVSDKAGIVEFAKGLQALGVEIISTGGTAMLLKDSGISALEVSQYTGFPEILDGRVKTLHPAIHGGLLALRDNPDHMEQLKKHNIGLIDMVVVNLYPFERVTQRKSVSLEEALENIDIGGPSMLRSAAKNFKSVAVVCNPGRYKEILIELEGNKGLLSDPVLMSLAMDVFNHTSRYDGVIFDYLKTRTQDTGFSKMPADMNFTFTKLQDLRYGENPHQAAAFYRDKKKAFGLGKLQQLHGKELSFNNLLDLDVAMEVVKDFDQPAAVVVKHNNPTGVAQSAKLADAYVQAWKGDPLSAFGGIIGLNKEVDAATAEKISKSGFMECVIAPGYHPSALKILTQKKNLRIIQVDPQEFQQGGITFKQVTGGVLLQEKDIKLITTADLKVVTKKKPTKSQIESLLFGWKVIKHVKSNSMVLVKGTKTVGIGCGQTSRVESTITAIKKAGAQAKGSCLVSEAFIPKIDNVQVAAKAGISVIIQTGGSVEDENVIRAADRAGMAMVFTGMRHFKH